MTVDVALYTEEEVEVIVLGDSSPPPATTSRMMDDADIDIPPTTLSPRPSRFNVRRSTGSEMWPAREILINRGYVWSESADDWVRSTPSSVRSTAPSEESIMEIPEEEEEVQILKVVPAPEKEEEVSVIQTTGNLVSGKGQLQFGVGAKLPSEIISKGFDN